jgi:hypothetical protein
MTTTREEIRMVLNGVFYGSCASPKEALGLVLGVGLPRIEYMSEDAIRANIAEAISLIEEISPDARVKRMITNSRKYLSRELTREQLVRFYTDMIMAGEGLSTLSGFGMSKISKTGGRRRATSAIKLNPERMTIYGGE